MQTKHIPILKLLLEKDAWITASALSKELHISIRTVKTYIRELNEVCPGIVASSSRGYHINFQLTLNLSSDALSIEGPEKNKRKLLSSLLYSESNENFVDLDSIQHAFLNLDIAFIRNSILDILSEYRYFINDYSLINLVLHVAIAVDRIQNHHTQNEATSPRDTPHLLSHEYELSNRIIRRMEEYFHVVFSEGEATEMALLLISRATSLNYQTITVENLDKFIGGDCMELVHEMLNEFSSYYYINLNEPEFLVRFALHIKNLLVRAQTEHFSRNPLADNIKISCPLIYDNAVWISSIIKERTGLMINDDEIAYIAFHLGRGGPGKNCHTGSYYIHSTHEHRIRRSKASGSAVFKRNRHCRYLSEN